MSLNILVTGAGGYIGGSLYAHLKSGAGGMVQPEKIHAVVRTQEQAESLSALGTNVLQADLSDEKALLGYVLRNEIDLIVHTATSTKPAITGNLISALARRREATGRPTHFIHTSGTSNFCEATGWPFGAVSDADHVLDLEKRLPNRYAQAQTDVQVTKEAEAKGVTSYIVFPTALYGTGGGTWNKFSVQVPGCIKASLKSGTVYKFPQNAECHFLHISDLTDFYARLIQSILDGNQIPGGREGCYFVLKHKVHWWDIMDSLAAALHARGLVSHPVAKVWPSDEMAAEAYAVPAMYARSIYTPSDANVTAHNAPKLGWEPRYDTQDLLNNMDREIQDYLDMGQVRKSSLLDGL
ncbi:hypothetical protein F4780DRAFT_739035 [Xylariomycetidae sp. FL0641]|nr:hypothetical protein F4780DRAFT_739035 [Xylariomycetidae sp. FL0641]